MAKPIGINWEQVKLMRYEGLTFKQIADKVGCKENTIAVRASREGWNVELKTAKATVQAMVRDKTYLTLQERAARFTAALADDVDATLDHVKQMGKPQDWENMVKAETVLEKLTKRGRSTYGLDHAGPSTVVNIAMMGEISSNPTTEAQVIDIQGVSEEEGS